TLSLGHDRGQTQVDALDLGIRAVAHEFSGAGSRIPAVPSPVRPEWPMAITPTGEPGSPLGVATGVTSRAVASGADDAEPEDAGEHPPANRSTAPSAAAWSVVRIGPIMRCP
ncbi:MAG: hypothetical protein M3295_07525, partial [Chloroflexota bacterium]|nr:hypothetical protein [Chloroflexota bacterium]